MKADFETLAPSIHLDVEMGEDQARVVLNPTPQDYTTGVIMKSAGGSGGTIGPSKRKLDSMGAIRCQSCLLNSEERLQQMRMSWTWPCRCRRSSRPRRKQSGRRKRRP